MLARGLRAFYAPVPRGSGDPAGGRLRGRQMLQASTKRLYTPARRPSRGLIFLGVMFALLAAMTARGRARVFHVGTFEGKRGGRSLQKAIELASPGDWILVAPGDYKETGYHVPVGADQGAGVL